MRARRRTAARAERPRPIDLEALAVRWQRALDAGERALDAARASLPAAEVGLRRRTLAGERQETAALLERVAHASGVRPAPWLSPVPVTPRMLGLPESTAACLFDLDGVLTDSGELHAWAWSVAFDEFLLPVSERTGWRFVPFDRDADYRAYIEGRSRIEGVHAFLDSRGIRVPEGRAGDSGRPETAWSLAGRKGELVARRLREHGVSARAGARRYLEAAGRAGLKRGVISASASTKRMLERAGLATLVEDRIDADVIRLERLSSPPAPDVLLAACARLGAGPAHAVVFTRSAAGVAAGRAAGVVPIGVGDEAEGRRLGVERLVPSLEALLDRRLAGSAPPAPRTPR